jgi:cystathionine gamma-synthase
MPGLRPETVAIHAGRGPRAAGEPLNPPLVPASNFHAAGYAREDGSLGWSPFEAAMGALEAYLALRGMRTLPVRLETAQRNAQTLAERLSERHVVHYPGLPGDPGHERATRLMDGYGAMLAFAHPEPDEVCGRVRVITHAKSLGGVESLIERRAPGLLRLSVGCEHVEDLWNDLERAL